MTYYYMMLCFILSIPIPLIANIKVELPKITIEEIQKGYYIEFELENTGAKPSTFFPLLQHFEGPANVLFSQEELNKWLLTDCDRIDNTDCQLRVIQKLGFLLKGDRYINAAFYITDPMGKDVPEFRVKAYSYPAALLSSYSLKCNDYASIVLNILCNLGVPNDNLRLVYGRNHSMVELFTQKYGWCLLDFDPDMPMLYTCNKLSLDDIKVLHKDEVIWPEINEWTYKSAHTATWLNNNAYSWPEYFDRITGNSSPGYDYLISCQKEFQDFNGGITLPPKSKIQVNHTNEVLIFNLSERKILGAYSHSRSLYFKANRLINKGYYFEALELGEKLVSLVTQLTGLEKHVAVPLLFGGHIGLTHSNTWHPLFRREDTPFYTITLPPGKYQLGADLKAPGKVLSVAGGIHDTLFLNDSLGNDTTITGNTHFKVIVSGSNNEVEIQNNALHYLQSGYAHVTDSMKIDVSWNPAVFNFLHGTLTIDELGEPDTLQFKYWVNGEMLL